MKNANGIAGKTKIIIAKLEPFERALVHESFIDILERSNGPFQIYRIH
jgi:hypothetical protein